MSSDDFELTLVRSSDDAPPFGAEYQAELSKFAKEAQASSQRAFAMDSVLGGGGPIQEAFADLIGMHRAYYSAIERGERNLTLGTLHRVAKGLGVRMADLMRDCNI